MYEVEWRLYGLYKRSPVCFICRDKLPKWAMAIVVVCVVLFAVVLIILAATVYVMCVKKSCESLVSTAYFHAVYLSIYSICLSVCAQVFGCTQMKQPEPLKYNETEEGSSVPPSLSSSSGRIFVLDVCLLYILIQCFWRLWA